MEIFLTKLKCANLTTGLNKCEFGWSEIKYLEFKVNQRGLRIYEEKIKPMVEFPRSKIVK